MDEEEDYGAYFDEEEDEEYSSPDLSKSVSKAAAAPTNYSYEVVDLGALKALFLKKILSLRSKFDYTNFAEGVYLLHLRQQQFMEVRTAKRMEEKMCEMLENEELQAVELDPKQSYMCNILCDEYPVDQVKHFGCGHTFENDCMAEYIKEEIKSKGPGSIDSKCPYEGCSLLITQTIVSACCDKALVNHFEKFTVEDFAKRAPFIIQCISPTRYLYFAAPENMVTNEGNLPQRNGICNCGTLVCLGCSGKGHEPLNCKMFEEWESSIGKIQDQLNEQWISQNAKKCPSCKVSIQKNQGCMHMTCRQCRHEFCWLCLGDWKKHGSNTGGFFACNQLNESTNDTKDQAALKRIQYFTDRFGAHKKSLEVSESKYREIWALMQDPDHVVHKMNTHITPKSLDFYLEAKKTIIQGRSFVAYTYPLAYFIKNEVELNLFLQTQYMLEFALERLDKFVETNPIDKMIMAKTPKDIFLVEDFPSKKQQLNSLVTSLHVQFDNCKREFLDPEFLKRVSQDKKLKFDYIADTILEKAKKDKPKGGVNKLDQLSEDGNSWQCRVCTYYNENNTRTNCVMCGGNGRPRR